MAKKVVKKKVDPRDQKITDLEYKLHQVTTNRDYFLRTNEELESKINRLEGQAMERRGAIDGQVHSLEKQVKNLVEIIRWKSNSETAKFPFQSQSDVINRNGRDCCC